MVRPWNLFDSKNTMIRRATDNSERRLKALVRRHGTPLVAISRCGLLRQLERFRKALPRVVPFYAIKANPHAEVLKTLVSAGANFDVASAAEMRGGAGGRGQARPLIFANTIKPVEAIVEARRLGVDLMTFDSEYELDKIAEHAPGSRVIVRIKVPNVGSIVELSLKFGAEPADAMGLLIKAHKLGLKPVGVSFHVGSQCTRVENYIQALEMAAIIVRDARLKQLPLEIVDIGGGFPIRHFDGEEDALRRRGCDDRPGDRPPVRRRTSSSSPSRGGSWWARRPR